MLCQSNSCPFKIKSLPVSLVTGLISCENPQLLTLKEILLAEVYFNVLAKFYPELVWLKATAQ